jgi:hypothetical protein
MSKPRSVWKNRPDGRTVRRHQGPPHDESWSWWSISMLESPACRVLNLAERRVIDRIRIEFHRHGGQDNGKLPVTFRDFHEYGVRWNSIAPAIRGAQALGWIKVTKYGVASNSGFRTPTLFALTHLETNGGQDARTNDWKAIKTIEDAEAIVTAARKEPARYGRFAKKKRRAKTGLRYRNDIEIGYRNDIEST